jgi:hypothetical protein
MLHLIAIISLSAGLLCALLILSDIIAGNRQPMMVMNFVYPISALYGGPLVVLFYYRIGKKAALKNSEMARTQMEITKKPFWQSVTIGALHCGSGCTLGDMLAETLLFFVPVSIFSSTLAGSWVIDFAFAFIMGILFQYYAIKPMKNISSAQAFKSALKADSLSLTFWQIGMYGWMAIAYFVIFGHKIPVSDPLFWFMIVYFGETDHPIPWQTDHLNCWRKDAANAVEAFTKIVI